jgi:hypothetical protein
MRFAIIASPRTGSSHLTDLLNSRPDVLCNGEICHPKKVFVNWRKSDRTPEKLTELAALRTTDARQFLERIYEIDYDRPHVGFKILRGQQENVFSAIMDDRAIKKVVLFRRNVLANYSSRLIAKETGQYGLNSKKASRETGERVKILFNADKFITHRNRYESYYASVMNSLLESGQNFHLINYEEINNIYFFKSLLAYIGADLHGLSDEGKHIKQNPPNILSRFSNPDAVETFLRENDLAHWSFEGQVAFDGKAAQRNRRKPAGRTKQSGFAPTSSTSGV